MSETLTALHAAIIDAPTDRTVRLVYADALDESGEPSNAARAEFIREQIALETMPDGDPQQAALAARCSELFADNWIAWWRPVCVAVGLPEPYVPTRRFRERMKRFVGSEKRELGAPYLAHPHAWSIESSEHHFTAQFIAGFPELLYLNANSVHMLARWASAIPFARLRWNGSGAEDWTWQALDAPSLAKLSALTLDRLPHDAAGIAQSPHLAGLNSLKVQPLNPVADVVRELVSRPAWAGLRSLTLSGVTPPDAIQMLAERCTLEELETLSFGIREVLEIPNLVGLTGALGIMFDQLLSQFFGNQLPPGPIHWPDYWPALESLARSPLFPRLRELQIIDPDARQNSPLNPANIANNLLRQFTRRGLRETPPTPTPEGIFPDTLVRALAAGLNPDKLVRLELPAARIARTGRAKLLRRFGPRLVLA